MTTTETLRAGDDVTFDTFFATYREAMDDEWDRPYSARELQVEFFSGYEYTKNVALLARDDAGVPVGVGTVELPLNDNLHLGYIEVHVVPVQRRKGHGAAIVEALSEIARAHDRRSLFAMARWGVGEQSSANTAFAESLGFTLDLVDAHRVLFLPAAMPKAPVRDGYTVHTWRGPCPDAWVDEYAKLLSLITQEAPSGDVSMENGFFDAARVRADEDALTQQGRVMQVSVALSADGAVAGHTQLVFPSSEQVDVFQYDTLVLREHRGHGLGLTLKVHTMNASTDLLEGRRFVHTYNAASNGPMIDVNEAMGFRQVANAGEFFGDISRAG